MWIRLLCNADPDSSWNQKEKIGLIKYLLYKVFMETLDFLFAFSDCSGIIWRGKNLKFKLSFPRCMAIWKRIRILHADPDPRGLS